MVEMTRFIKTAKIRREVNLKMKNKQFSFKKMVSVTGEYSYRNFTVFDIIKSKDRRKLTKTLQILAEEAKAAEKSGTVAMHIRYLPA